MYVTLYVFTYSGFQTNRILQGDWDYGLQLVEGLTENRTNTVGFVANILKKSGWKLLAVASGHLLQKGAVPTKFDIRKCRPVQVTVKLILFILYFYGVNTLVYLLTVLLCASSFHATSGDVITLNMRTKQAYIYSFYAFVKKDKRFANYRRFVNSLMYAFCCAAAT